MRSQLPPHPSTNPNPERLRFGAGAMLAGRDMKDRTTHVPSEEEAARARAQWVLKKRRRAFRNVWRILESNIAAMARRAQRQRRRRRPRQEEGGEADAVAEFRRQVMPLMTELAQLAGVKPASLGRRETSKLRRAQQE